jgi:hypothetical protein
VCHDINALRAVNLLALAHALEEMGLASTFDILESAYNELLGLVKTAAEQSWSDRPAKVVTAESLRQAIRAWVDPLPGQTAIMKLERKMSAAGLGETDIVAAKELRRRYRQECLTPRYLTIEDHDGLSVEILVRLLRLRAMRASGQVSTEGAVFHAVCLDSIGRPFATVSEEHARNLPPGYTEGCMYDIVSRCAHDFVKVSV